MRISLCSEVIGQLEFAAQCDLAAALGYDGLEIAPVTLAKDPRLISAEQRTMMRRAAETARIALTGLHWLMVMPPGLSITSSDPSIRRNSLEVIRSLVDLCAELGGSVLVHGSPDQRRLPEGPEAETARKLGIEAMAVAAEAAEKAGVIYCLEPLSPDQTNFVTSVAEAVEIVDQIGSPALRTMIDTSAAGRGEIEPVADLIRRWLPDKRVVHIHLNDTNRRAPGQGGDDFPEIMRALKDVGYDGIAGVEPFIYDPDGPTVAARAIGYIQGLREALG